VSEQSTYFFCGVGGSGMLPLAQFLRAKGHRVFGSDRAYDQGRSPEKFSRIQEFGITLCPQDGSGVTDGMILVVSSAVESHIPDVAAAQKLGIPIIKRAELLAQVFHTAKTRIAVAGTSGKSTVTAMIGFLLHHLGAQPNIINGAVMSDFVTADNPFASFVVGDNDFFVIEADESDGSIELYRPTIAVLNNIALDHKPMAELKSLFADFLKRADISVINAEHDIVSDLAKDLSHVVRVTHDKLKNITLSVAGAHNRMNAAMAVAAVVACGFPEERALQLIPNFKGVKRRLEYVGSTGNITVIDDFAHNPDKITASLAALKETGGRLLILFQMHGFAPLKLMFNELRDAFAQGLADDDILYMPEVLYLGGTTQRDVTAKDFVTELQTYNVNAHWFAQRNEIINAIRYAARAGDRIVIMGARDDTLSDVAREILKNLDEK
jgi:UDP-N-acetylmuramate--alanine ligase